MRFAGFEQSATDKPMVILAPSRGEDCMPDSVWRTCATQGQRRVENRLRKERARLRSRLSSIRNRMDFAYVDKLGGKIPEDLWERKMTEWRTEEQKGKLALDGLARTENTDRALDAQRVFELANKVYLLYFCRIPLKTKLLRMMCPNFSVDALSVRPAYKYPFKLIFERDKLEEWSALIGDFRTFAFQITNS